MQGSLYCVIWYQLHMQVPKVIAEDWYMLL